MNIARMWEQKNTRTDIKSDIEYLSKPGNGIAEPRHTTLITRREVNEFTIKALKTILAFEEEQKAEKLKKSKEER